MPTLATGTSTELPRPARGFSLLELLVVLLLIGIILTMATLSVGPVGNRADSASEAHRLAALLQLAREQAVLQGLEHGLEVSRGGYRVLAFEDDQWAPLSDTTWRPRVLPEGLRLDLAIEGRALALPAEQPGEPQLLLLSSDEMTPFEIEFSDATLRCRLTGDGLADLPPPTCEAA